MDIAINSGDATTRALKNSTDDALSDALALEPGTDAALALFQVLADEAMVQGVQSELIGANGGRRVVWRRTPATTGNGLTRR
jgi:hypothetical protein